jgi:serine kinase of HPr protein (carbohydrate metabolism regulator)
MIIHAGLIACRTGGVWRGVLVEGPSGSGKSDLALRAIGEGFSLVADDRTLMFQSGGRLFGRAPASLHGLIEARGVGIVRHTARPFASVDLLVRCESTPEAVERMPPYDTTVISGVAIPGISLWPFENSAPAKIRRAIEHLGAGA